jgi:predicted AAA+ superfamily ATPase
MVNRLFKPSQTQSFFLFGARGVGKSTLLKRHFDDHDRVVFIDLLEPKTEDLFRVHPDELTQIVRNQKPEWIVIDEVQKLPRLLDLVHFHIENDQQKFVLSGSSAHKLKRGSANLLAGRATMNHLHPLTANELGQAFDLHHALSWGLLPKIYGLNTDGEKFDFLESYCLTYLKEEIVSEQIVRNLDPFRNFLPIAAQMSGKIINYSKIAREVGVDTTTVQNYFSILEDTLIGFTLPAFHRSVRKRQRLAPKFYLFDLGVTRALAGILDVPVRKATGSFGNYFEHFLIQEIRKLADYKKIRWNFSYLMTKDNVEIDLILERPSRPLILIEIKSADNIQREDIASFIKVTSAFTDARSYCFSSDPRKKIFDHVECLHWQEGLAALGLTDSAPPTN